MMTFMRHNLALSEIAAKGPSRAIDPLGAPVLGNRVFSRPLRAKSRFRSDLCECLPPLRPSAFLARPGTRRARARRGRAGGSRAGAPRLERGARDGGKPRVHAGAAPCVGRRSRLAA